MNYDFYDVIIQELSKQDKLWRQISFNICKNRMLADDLVNDMYLKLMNKTKYNKYFVAITIKNLFIDHIRKERTTSLEEYHFVQDITNNFEPDDSQQKVLEEFENLDWIKQELLLERSTDRSIREIGKIYNINYNYIFRQCDQAKKQIMQAI